MIIKIGIFILFGKFFFKFKIIQEAGMCRGFRRSNGENGDVSETPAEVVVSQVSEKYIYFKFVFKGYCAFQCSII